MIKSLNLSCGASLESLVNSNYDYNKRSTDEYQTEIIVRINDNRTLICSDYLNFIVGEFLRRLGSLDDLELLKVFKDFPIGMAYNDYLYHIDNEEELCHDYLKKNNDIWVGDKYLLFELPQKRATWLYNLNDKHYLEITPLYENHFADSDRLSYSNFLSKFTTTIKIELTDKDICDFKKILNTFI